MKVEEVVLPGVGRKFSITVQSGDRLVIVVHSSGRRELQYFEAGSEDEPSAALDLTDEEAREIGAILAGVLFHPEAVGDTQSKLGQKVIEWIKVLPVPSSRASGWGTSTCPRGPISWPWTVPGPPLCRIPPRRRSSRWGTPWWWREAGRRWRP